MKKFFRIDFIYIEGLIVAGLTILGGVAGIIFYLTDSEGTIEDLILYICLIVVGSLVLIFREKLRHWMT